MNADDPRLDPAERNGLTTTTRRAVALAKARTDLALCAFVRAQAVIAAKSEAKRS